MAIDNITFPRLEEGSETLLWKRRCQI
jgi:hypothetical protein